MASSDATAIPIKNQAYRVTFPIFDADGDLVTGAAGLDSERSLDGANFADCASEAVEIGVASGMYYLDLTAGEMNADTVAVIVKTVTVGAKTTPIVLYPAEPTDIIVNVKAISDDVVAPDNLETAYDGGAYNVGGGAIVAASVTGAVGSVTGNVGGNVGGNVTGTVASVVGNVGGNVVGTVASVVGDVGGNVVGTVASVVGAVGSVTGNVGGNVVGNVTGTVASVVGNVGGNVIGTVASVVGNIGGNVVGTVASVVGAVGSVTGNVGGNVVGTVASVVGNVGGNVIGTVASVVGAVGSVAGNVVGSVGSVLGNVGGNVTGTVASVAGNVGGNVVGSIGSLAAAAQADVNAEVLDVLTVDAFAEPGQEAPAATNTLAVKIAYLFKFLRNKITQNATTISVFNDAGAVVDQKATSSDVAGTYTRGEFGTGP